MKLDLTADDARYLLDLIDAQRDAAMAPYLRTTAVPHPPPVPPQLAAKLAWLDRTFRRPLITWLASLPPGI